MVFNNALRKGIANVVTWTSFIDAHGLHGFGKKAKALFDEMQTHNIAPNSTTLICELNACSHAKMHDEAWEIYSTMQERFGVAPTDRHHACMVDAWSRAGLFDRADQFIQTLNSPGVVMRKTLLGASHHHGNVEVARKAAIFKMVKAGGITHIKLPLVQFADKL